jgi:formiminotetrahydrofolate cyclodeaminase
MKNETDKWMNELVKSYRLPKDVNDKKREKKKMLTESQRKIIEGKG